MEDDQHKSNREITYHVGWKRGKIRLPDGKAISPASKEGTVPAAVRLVRHVEAFIWKPVPFVPDKAWIYAVVLLPLIGFAASVALVIFMMRTA